MTRIPRVAILLLTLAAIAGLGLDPAQIFAAPQANGANRAARFTVRQEPVMETYGKLSLSFEANRGQTDPGVKFLSRGMGYTLLLTGDEAVPQLRKLMQKARSEGQGTATNNTL